MTHSGREAADAARRGRTLRIGDIGAVGSQFMGSPENIAFNTGGGYVTGVALWIVYRR